ncbi:MAG: ComEA family DNA-binding protein [Candidatus Kapaibacterium sp.]
MLCRLSPLFNNLDHPAGIPDRSGALMSLDPESDIPSRPTEPRKERLTFTEMQLRATEWLQVTRSELIVAGFILCYTTFSVVVRIMESPDDPFDHRLRAEIRRRIDSAAAVRDSVIFALPPGASARATESARRRSPALRKKQAPARPMDINTVSRDSLCLIPGIGPAIAQRIIVRRERRRFRSMKELRSVKGIGPRLYAKISPHLSVTPKPERRP